MKSKPPRGETSKENSTDTSELVTGAHVEFARFKRRGVIVDGPNSRNEFLVEMANLSLWIPAVDLKRTASAKNQSKKAPSRSVSRSGSSTRTRKRTIDLHGKTKQQALEILEHTLDRALLEHLDCIEIIHGIGTGILQRTVEEYLRNSHHIVHFRLQEGNPGTTLAYLS